MIDQIRQVMGEKPVTLREVAAKANVSVATVSYVLSGKGRMAPQTRRHVEGLLREAGLRPRYKRYPIVYLSDHREFSDMQAFNPFLQMFDGLSSALQEADLTLRIEFLHKPGKQSPRDQIAELIGSRIGAAVLDTNLRDDVEDVARLLQQQEIPAVQVGHTVRSTLIDAAVIDSFGGAYAATRHLISQGHTRIATIRWNVSGDPASAKKFAGFTCALSEAGVSLPEEYVVESPYTKDEDVQPGRVAVERLLSLPQPPTAVFVENTFISPSLIYTINERETQLPPAIAKLDMVHFEAWHLEWLEQVIAGKLSFSHRKTKLLRINWEELGRMAARRLLERMEGRTGGPEVLQLVPKLYFADGDELTAIEG
jgi:LacI family transcriptional regulator